MPIDPNSSTWLGYSVALGIGLLIGAERERNKGEGAARASEGIRTFSIAALLGAVSLSIHLALLVTTVLCVMLFSALGYYTQFKQQQHDPGMTTELAFVMTVVLGGLALLQPSLAAAIAVMVAILLAAKQPIHVFVRKKMTGAELNDLLVLAAATLVILPIMPDQALGPFHAINPQHVWLVVILVMSISALSHVMLRLTGARMGLPLVGFVSGFISSLAVIQSMGARAREQPEQVYAAVASASWSSLATLIQISLLLAAVYAPLLQLMAWPLLSGAISMLCFAGWMTFKSWHSTFAPNTSTSKMVKLSSALSLALVLAGVILLAAGLTHYFGQTGLLLGSGFAGLADAHAPTVAVASLAAAGQLTLVAGVAPILLAYSSNAMAKVLVAFLSHQRRYAFWVTLGLLMQLLAVWLTWWLSKSVASSTLL